MNSFRIGCNSTREADSFVLWPHVLYIRSILRDLSRIRAELADEFSAAIRKVKVMNHPETKTPAGDATRNIGSSPSKNILETAIATGNSASFAACVKAAGLTDALAAKGPFTVFVPTDEAFKKLPAGAYESLLKDSAKLKAVLNYHIVPGYLMSRDIKAGEVMTLQGSTLTAAVMPSEVRINGAHVVQANVAATNGVVHTIDAVILPKNWQLLAAAA